MTSRSDSKNCLPIDEKLFQRLFENWKYLEEVRKLETLFASLIESYVKLEQNRIIESVDIFLGVKKNLIDKNKAAHHAELRKFYSQKLLFLTLVRAYIDSTHHFLNNHFTPKITNKYRSQLSGYNVRADGTIHTEKPKVFENCFFWQLRNLYQHHSVDFVKPSYSYTTNLSRSGYRNSEVKTFFQINIESINNPPNKNLIILEKKFPTKWEILTGHGPFVGDLSEILPAYVRNLGQTHNELREQVLYRSVRAEKVFATARKKYHKAFPSYARETSLFVYPHKPPPFSLEADKSFNIGESFLKEIEEMQEEFKDYNNLSQRLHVVNYVPDTLTP